MNSYENGIFNLILWPSHKIMNFNMREINGGIHENSITAGDGT